METTWVSTKNMIDIILADNHSLYREVVKLWIENEQIGTVLAEASNGFELLTLLENYNPDLVIMDIEMPLMNGIQATKQALKLHPTLKILALTRQGDKRKHLEVALAGVAGLIKKNSDKKEFEYAIRMIENGEKYYDSNFQLAK